MSEEFYRLGLWPPCVIAETNAMWAAVRAAGEEIIDRGMVIRRRPIGQLLETGEIDLAVEVMHACGLRRLRICASLQLRSSSLPFRSP
jgi:hypothetical protein